MWELNNGTTGSWMPTMTFEIWFLIYSYTTTLGEKYEVYGKQGGATWEVKTIECP